MSDLRRSPLHGRHEQLGAKLADFGGWEMPIEYPGADGGVLREHQAVREAVGVFDVSHLGKGLVRGPGAAAFVNARLTNDLSRIGPGQAQYTLCCQDDGGVVDDLIAYLRSADEVFLIPNAANSSQVVARLANDANDANDAPVEVLDLHTDLAVLAIQGPGSAQLLQTLGLPTGHDYMSFVTASWQGRPLTVCRTGYTGELGFELLPAWADAGPLWDAVLAAGAQPCGLGARDTLRTEMGYALHGHELSPQITPVQARSGWAVGWDKPQFWGKAALEAERDRGPDRQLWGLESLDRGIPRPGMTVRAGERVLGEVTSGTFSPTRRIGIGLALLARGTRVDDEVSVDVRGRASRARVVAPPFVASHVR